jgi:NAD(P)-dependent dehydrogenase (short-subunit alcohol dehydrogenase family)
VRAWHRAGMTSTDTLYDLQGRTALVTGATSGIGRAVAIALAAYGADVLIHGRDAERGAEVVQAIVDAGGRARFLAADLTVTADAQRLADAAGDVDILVNNAGISLWAPTGALALDGYDKMFDGNVRAPFVLVATLAPKMAARGRGAIVSISSMAGDIGMPGGAAYGATKAALEAMTRAWAAELGGAAFASTPSRRGPCTPPRRPGRSSSGSAAPPLPSIAPPNPRRSPKSWRSSSPTAPATSPARPSPPTVGAPPSRSNRHGRTSAVPPRDAAS